METSPSTWQQVVDVTTVIANIGVIAGIVSLAVQLRHFNSTIRHDAYSKAVEYFSRINEIQLEKPHITDQLYGKESVYMKLPKDEKDAYMFIFYELGLIERLYQIYNNNWIDKETWGAWESFLRDGMLARPLFYVVWDCEKYQLVAEFVEYVDSMIAKKRSA